VKSPNLNTYNEALLLEVQELEDAILAVMVSRLVGQATAAQLDIVGRVVGKPRLGLSDSDYRAAIQFQIFLNHHSATPANLAEICRRLTQATAVEYIEATPAVYRLRVEGGSLPAGITAQMQQLTGAGIRLLDVHTNPYVARRFGEVLGRRFFDEEI
jgi:hypothetical protein